MEGLLNIIRRFITLSSDEEQLIRAYFKPLALPAKEHFLEQGKVCRHVGFISRGIVRYYTTVDGEERTMSFNEENEFVCNYPSFLPGLPSEVAIQAIEPTDLFVISYDDLQHFYRNIKEGERFGRLAIEQVYLSVMEEMRSHYSDLPPERYRRLLQVHPDLVQRLPQYFVASFVGVKPQSLSRIRRRLAESS